MQLVFMFSSLLLLVSHAEENDWRETSIIQIKTFKTMSSSIGGALRRVAHKRGLAGVFADF